MYTDPPPETPEYEHIARYLAEPVEAVWTAFDKGRAAADEFFAPSEQRKNGERKFDPHLWAHIARYEAVLSLHGRDDAAARVWQVTFPHHSGIRIAMDPFTIMVCKAAGDNPQSPGRNRARRMFFQQLALGFFTHTNLILYWRVTDGALELGLCKPKGLWRFKGNPNLEWRLPISFDPISGLKFHAAADDGLDVRLAGDDLGAEEQKGG